MNGIPDIPRCEDIAGGVCIYGGWTKKILGHSGEKHFLGPIILVHSIDRIHGDEIKLKLFIEV